MGVSWMDWGDMGGCEERCGSSEAKAAYCRYHVRAWVRAVVPSENEP